MTREETTIGICGLWHLGCVLSAAWTKLGFPVIGFDDEKDKIAQLKDGKPPLYEPNLEQTLATQLGEGRLQFTDRIDELHHCDFVFIAFDTPVLENDQCDLTPLQKAIDGLAGTLQGDTVVVVSSQTPVGTCSRFRAQLQRKSAATELVYSPENLRLGQAIECYLNPGRVILGAASEDARQKALALFRVIDAEIITMNLASAEMVKHAINSFLATSIVFADHLADLCEASGADISDVVGGMKSDDRIGPRAYLSPGIGFSGGTLGRDLRVLSELGASLGRETMIYDAIHDFNTDRKNVIVDRVAALLGGQISRQTIAVLGLTYKPGTSTLRRSVPFEIAQMLSRMGAKVKAYDPRADYTELTATPDFDICRSVDDALQDSDLTLLLTEWPEFRQYDWDRGATLMRHKCVFDAKNFLADTGLPEKGFRYAGVGRTGQ